jgi:hypothetical protein
MNFPFQKYLKKMYLGGEKDKKIHEARTYGVKLQ